MITAIFGLLGVVLGVTLTTFRDWWLRRTIKKEEQIYLVTHVSCLLERFISGCVDVAYDNGLFEGQRDRHGCLAVQVTAPSFEPLQFKDVNWKSLPAGLMYQVLRLPNKIKNADSYVADVAKYVASGPDYEEIFEARKEKYSELGLHAIKVLEELCLLANLPNELNNDDEWAPKNRLKKALDQVKLERAERYAQFKAPPPLTNEATPDFD